jgi:hypothetical protein
VLRLWACGSEEQERQRLHLVRVCERCV